MVYNPVTFKDILNHWVKNAVNDMGSRMVVTGIGNGNYEPQRSITRAGFAAIIVRAVKLTGLAVTLTGGEVSALLSVYADRTSVSAYTKESAAACLKTGVISGKTTTTISPKDSVTRAEITVMVQRLLQQSGLNPLPYLSSQNTNHSPKIQ